MHFRAVERLLNCLSSSSRSKVLKIHVTSFWCGDLVVLGNAVTLESVAVEEKMPGMRSLIGIRMIILFNTSFA